MVQVGHDGVPTVDVTESAVGSSIQSVMGSATVKLQGEHSSIQSSLDAGVGLDSVIWSSTQSEIESKLENTAVLSSLESELESGIGQLDQGHSEIIEDLSEIESKLDVGFSQSQVESASHSELESKVASGIGQLADGHSEIESDLSVIMSQVGSAIIIDVSELQSKLESGIGYLADGHSEIIRDTSEMQSKIMSNILGPQALMLTQFHSELGTLTDIPQDSWVSLLLLHAEHPMKIKAFWISCIGIEDPRVRITVNGAKMWPFNPWDYFVNGCEEVLDETMDIPECCSYGVEIFSESATNASCMVYTKEIDLLQGCG